MKIVIFGATGIAGSEVIRQAIAETKIEEVLWYHATGSGHADFC